jgi:uncharacterized protein (TIGR02421 family)
MSSHPNLKSAPPPFEAKFAKSGALREAIGETGRVHVDRWLPFLIVHRSERPEASLARRIAVDSPSYLVWSPADDLAAMSAIEAVATRLVDQQGRLLIVTLDDQPFEPHSEGSQELPPFTAQIAAGDKGHVGRAASILDKAIHGIAIDLRHCKVERVPAVSLLPDRFDKLFHGIDGVERLSLRVPQIHRRGDELEYPGIRHDLAASFGDALLRTACAFLDDGKTEVPDHYRSLGRSAYIAAALKADKRLDRVSRSFDFLLSISPIDTAKAYQRFKASGHDEVPHFHYRPLTVDPDLAKRELYSIDLDSLEDPMLEQLLAEKRREIDAQLTMLATRNTPAFRAASMFLYGSVETPLLEAATQILASSSTDPPRGEAVGAVDVATAARELCNRYRAIDSDFDAEIQVRDDVAGLLVSGAKLMIGSDSIMPAHRLQPLLAHEVSVHLLTHFNGAAQGLTIFRTGLAGYEGIQEGLGVFAEWAMGGLTRTRLRLLAARVVAVEAMLAGATFIDVYRTLTKQHEFSRKGAFGIAARVFRSGGLAKDAIYLRGFSQVMDLARSGASLEPYWLGKIASRHAPVIEELLQRGLVRPPRITPLFLAEAGAKDRIAGLARSASLNDILQGS